jgi:glutamine amidotransferase
MQLLFDASEESPGRGIGFIPGKVTRLRTATVPHMGWNEIEWRSNGEKRTTPNIETAYFANAYVCQPDDDSTVVAWTTHQDARFASVVRSANTVGVQFHPEKSSFAGRTFVNTVIEELLECT